MEGTVKFFNHEKRFGFINSEETDKDVFVHESGTNQAIEEGDQVSFELQESDRGPVAVNVSKQ